MTPTEKNLYRVTLRKETIVFVVASDRQEAEAIAEAHEDYHDFETSSFAAKVDQVSAYEHEALIIDPDLNDAYVTVGEWLKYHVTVGELLKLHPGSFDD